ncbi:MULTISPECIES: TetR/AcrR family transcriptional regulator [unclassified Ensifer]|uniref:TetR/AcrR family transcriptional regulator n=1 Tax=unclassified Ensifer TaxID=2633371 RepID=UPI0008132335|nr:MULTISPECIES: TetR/AcrR family transcriptional regulator [unclassified Ensifer]OCP09419.1 TetR family transcriptional regulator [Ensifer sp. LC13]OCP10830.1 TetR family transcriptional regulator [Ensifer sp. LC11]OCP11646.1 TetR family transcriptional regulator [Ensifer sp. LC14]OCP32667.1 TetR family transcriptional regulator [Ensifer sp. LC499]
MARPLSEEKRQAILESAINTMAELGLGAPTARIAKGAGVAEGTLFIYFPNKDALLNELYLELKREIAEEMLAGYRSDADHRTQWRHVWDRYIEWGAKHPARRKAMRQLVVSDRVLEQSRVAGARAFEDIQQLFDKSLSSGALREQPAAFLAGVMEAIAEVTLDFVARQPERMEEFKQLGFQAFWTGVA